MTTEVAIEQITDVPPMKAAHSSNSPRRLSVEQREFVQQLRRLYKADHQAEYLYLQAEVDSLWIQLEQARKLANTFS